MAKKSAAATLKQLQNKLDATIKNIEATEFIANVPEVIRERTRNGYGITRDDGKIVSLPALKESTINHRIRMDDRGELSRETTPFFSNLTAEGILLDSMRSRKIGANKYEVAFDNRRKRNGKSPEQIKDYLEEKGFVFFGLAKQEREQLNEKVAAKLEKEIAKIFK